MGSGVVDSQPIQRQGQRFVGDNLVDCRHDPLEASDLRRPERITRLLEVLHVVHRKSGDSLWQLFHRSDNLLRCSLRTEPLVDFEDCFLYCDPGYTSRPDVLAVRETMNARAVFCGDLLNQVTPDYPI